MDRAVAIYLNNLTVNSVNADTEYVKRLYVWSVSRTRRLRWRNSLLKCCLDLSNSRTMVGVQLVSSEYVVCIMRCSSTTATRSVLNPWVHQIFRYPWSFHDFSWDHPVREFMEFKILQTISSFELRHSFAATLFLNQPCLSLLNSFQRLTVTEFPIDLVHLKRILTRYKSGAAEWFFPTSSPI